MRGGERGGGSEHKGHAGADHAPMRQPTAHTHQRDGGACGAGIAFDAPTGRGSGCQPHGVVGASRRCGEVGGTRGHSCGTPGGLNALRRGRGQTLRGLGTLADSTRMGCLLYPPGSSNSITWTSTPPAEPGITRQCCLPVPSSTAQVSTEAMPLRQRHTGELSTTECTSAMHTGSSNRGDAAPDAPARL